MPQFTLDYTTQRPSPIRTRSKKSLSARLFLVFVGWNILSPIIVAVLLVVVFRYHSSHQTLDYQHRMHLVRYDSLLTTKQKTDRQLMELLRKQGSPKIIQHR